MLQGLHALRYLLDTNAWIGFFEGRKGFGSRAKELITESPGECVVSIASIWEAAIKTSLGKLHLPYDLEEDLPRLLARNGFEVLPISFSEAAAVKDLPAVHGDPFDRLLAVQARLNALDIVSSDQVFEAYGLRRIW